MRHPLLAVFPHPDDETVTSGGLMAAAVERRVPVTLVCATRGEAGESSIPGIADSDRLGEVRERELREAMRHLGVSDVRFLDYRDSGMEGSANASNPRAFIQAPVDQAAVQVALIIREVRPGMVVTYGPEGVYGHPDHIHLYRVATRAVHLAADPATAAQGQAIPWQTPALYYGTTPREELLRILDRPNGPLAKLSATALANLGTPRAEITHVLDTRAWIEAKLAAMLAHRTQTGEGGPLSGITLDMLVERLAQEYFVRAPLPWRAGDELDLLDLLSDEQTSI